MDRWIFNIISSLSVRRDLFPLCGWTPGLSWNIRMNWIDVASNHQSGIDSNDPFLSSDYGNITIRILSSECSLTFLIFIDNLPIPFSNLLQILMTLFVSLFCYFRNYFCYKLMQSIFMEINLKKYTIKIHLKEYTIKWQILLWKVYYFLLYIYFCKSCIIFERE